eukprot:gene16029-17649_t
MSSYRRKVDVDPYTTQYVSLGSGPRERASSCGCNYRTSSAKQSSSCYTRLVKDPPLISCQRQRAVEVLNRTDAPLVNLLMREQSFEKASPKIGKRRPFSAATCSQMDKQRVKPGYGELISVRGKNLHYQQRPVSRKSSDDFITNKAIRSVSEATATEISKLSSFYSDMEPRPLPRPPCPSPDPHSEGSFSSEPEENNDGDVRRLPLEEREAKFDELRRDAVSESSGHHQFATQEERCPNITAAEEQIEQSCKGDIKEEKEGEEVDIFDLLESRCRMDECSWQDANTEKAKTRLHLTIPTVDEPPSDNETRANSSIADGSLKHEDDKAMKRNYACGNTETKILVSDMKSTKRSLGSSRARPVSAHAVMGSGVRAIRAKTIEFIDNKDLAEARFALSNRTLETILYMKHLSEKQRPKQRLIDDSESESGREVELDETVKRHRNLSCSSKKIEVFPEKQITSKPPLQRHAKVEHGEEAGHIGFKVVADRTAIKNSAKTPKEITANMNEKRAAMAKKILKKADAQLGRKKEETKENASFIWRSITRINTVGSEKADASNENVAEKEKISDSCCFGFPGEEHQADINLNDTKRPVNPSDIERCEIASNNNILLKYANTDPSVKHVVFQDEMIGGASQSRVQSIPCANRQERILRPTSAVIQLHKETRKDGIDQNRKKRRPRSSYAAMTRVNKMQTAATTTGAAHVKSRPLSAAVQRISAKKMPFVEGVTATSAKKVDFNIPNTEVAKVERHKESGGAWENKRKKQRPTSATSKHVMETKNVDLLDIRQEKKKISQECYNVMNAFDRKGIKVSLDTITRALMPPCETAKKYSRSNLPHSSRLLTNP